MPFLLFYCVLPDLAVYLEPGFGFRFVIFTVTSDFLFVLCIPFFILFYLLLTVIIFYFL